MCSSNDNTFEFNAYLCTELKRNYFSTTLFGMDEDEIVITSSGVTLVELDNVLIMLDFAHSTIRPSYDAHIEVIVNSCMR